ncbi:electrogenic sodium bicarbonate cotransporter 1-like isoform X2 [Carassius gibelio]|uniref:electrogenic sodium bicarbonate cotransporter 1-like isoform X2 n=1 Tax=Carassius gibelio TaxID=101364 RepID=UPI002278DFEB|nr:electrogenic sodium bicarbonate cotransporter 1-like isoform X2 [Carassius gibelio]
MFLKKFKMSPFFPTIPTSPNRGWFVPPFGGIPWWVYLAAALPVLLVTILLFMDQQITAVIVNRKEHKLKGTESNWYLFLHPHRSWLWLL